MKFCVSKMGLDCIALMEEVLLQAWESLLTVEIPRHEEKVNAAPQMNTYSWAVDANQQHQMEQHM